MNKGSILVVEDDIDVGNMLKIYFSGFGYDVYVVVRGSDALERVHYLLPHLIILDIMLPDIDGYEVCRNLRVNMRTSHISVIFLTQKDERSDKLQGLELGADDYMTKPFDIEELRLRVQGAFRRSERESLTNLKSGLPAGRLIEDQLRRVIREKGWALLDARLNNFDSFKDVYGYISGDDVLRFTAMLIGEVVDEMGTTSDFIGHAGGDNFVIITTEKKVSKLKSRLKEKFNQEVQTHYNFIDRQQGYMQAPAKDGTTFKAPFMTMSVGAVSSRGHSFADIREITELAAERRRIEEQLRRTISETGWAYLYLHIKYFKAYQKVYGFNESHEVIWFTIKMIRDVMSELQVVDGFIGHATKDKFVIILPEKLSKAIRKELKTRFETNILSHYHDIHLKLGYIWTDKGKKNLSLMKLSVSRVSPKHNIFTDIIDITQLAD